MHAGMPMVKILSSHSFDTPSLIKARSLTQSASSVCRNRMTFDITPKQEAATHAQAIPETPRWSGLRQSVKSRMMITQTIINQFIIGVRELPMARQIEWQTQMIVKGNCESRSTRKYCQPSSCTSGDAPSTPRSQRAMISPAIAELEPKRTANMTDCLAASLAVSISRAPQCRLTMAVVPTDNATVISIMKNQTCPQIPMAACTCEPSLPATQTSQKLATDMLDICKSRGQVICQMAAQVEPLKMTSSINLSFDIKKY